MRHVPPFRSEPRWVPVVRQLAGVLTIAAAAVAAAAITVGWAIERERQPIVLGPDSTTAVYPVCATGDLLWFPQRRLPPASGRR